MYCLFFSGGWILQSYFAGSLNITSNFSTAGSTDQNCDIVASNPSDTKQLWFIDITASPSIYQIRSMANPTVALDLRGASSANDTPVTAYPVGNQDNQKWAFVK